VEAKESLYVPRPAVPAAVDSVLAPLGWEPGKFAAELRKEIRYQLNRKGVATPDDSAGAAARLDVSVDRYEGKDYPGQARLTTPAGKREIGLRKPPKRKASEERDDPTVDNIRIIAAKLAEDVRSDPRHVKKQPEAFSGMIMLF
jgi:cell division septation protein DedD